MGLKSVMDELVEVAGTYHPALNVYRWWRADVKLPAVWHWLTPGDTEAIGISAGGACKVIDRLRITQTLAVDPTAVAGEGDMLEVEELFDSVVPKLDAVVYRFEPFGEQEAFRRGAQTVANELGGASILELELPIEVHIARSVLPPP